MKHPAPCNHPAPPGYFLEMLMMIREREVVKGMESMLLPLFSKL